MALFGKADQQNNAPKNVVDDKGTTGTNLYANTAGANTLYGADTTEVGVMNKKIAHAGWVQRRRGKGPLVDLTRVAGGTGYNNADTISIQAATGVNATATLTTNSTGGIATITVTNVGGLFYGSETVTITTSGGSAANLVPTFGGRAGRTTFETMVAMGSMTGDGSDDTVLPDA